MTGPACLQCGLAAAQALSSISTEINLGCRNADGALECQFNLKRRKADNLAVYNAVLKAIREHAPQPRKMTERCIDCDGKGVYPSGETCLSCGGSGRVEVGDGEPGSPSTAMTASAETTALADELHATVCQPIETRNYSTKLMLKIVNALRASPPPPADTVRDALDLLSLVQRGRAKAFRIMDQARAVSDPATLAKADAYEECGNELFAALSVPAPIEAGWRDISTAPKDGTEFLAALSNGWRVILSEPRGSERFAWYTSSARISVPIARTHREGSLTESLLATHWMPLPSPPVSRNDETSGGARS